MTLKTGSLALMSALLAAAATPPHYLLVDPSSEAALDLKEHGFIDFNAEIVNPKKKAEQAARLTDAGTAEATKTDAGAGTGSTAATATKPVFKIVQFELPPRPATTRASSTREPKYPTAQLEPGTAFFIPYEGGVKPANNKTFTQIASNANKKYNDLAPGGDFRYFDVRELADGGVLDPDYAGKAGVAIGRLSVVSASAKRDSLIANPPKPRAPRKPKVAVA